MSAIQYFRDIVTTDRRLTEVQNFGGKVVGVYCNFVPEALIYALGALPVRLCSGDREAARAGEELFPRDSCSMVKACVGQAIRHDPLFARLDLLVIPTSCDAKTKLGALLEPYKPIHLMHLPRSKNAVRAWTEEVWVLLARLEKLTGRTLTRESLEQAIVQLNARQHAFRRFLALRQQVPAAITGEESLVVTTASFTDDLTRWTAQLEALCAERESQPPRPKRPRLLLTGAPLISPHLKLVHLLEEAGAEIAIDDLCSGAQRLYDPIIYRDPSTRAMVESVAERHLLPATCPCFANHTDRLKRVLELAEQYHVDGVISHSLRVCPPFDIESITLLRTLKERGLPCLHLTTDYGQDDTEQMKTRVAAFLEMLESAQ